MNGGFERLEVWQRSRILAGRVYRVLEGCKDWGFKNQITAAVVSISSNIAEGAERTSKAEFRQFLAYAKGSAGEVKSQLFIAEDLGYVDGVSGKAMRAELEEIGRMIHGLQNSMVNRK
jgi:four helix bundle protein